MENLNTAMENLDIEVADEIVPSKDDGQLFVAAAIQGLLANGSVTEPELVARLAYQHAAAAIRELNRLRDVRNKEKPPQALHVGRAMSQRDRW